MQERPERLARLARTNALLYGLFLIPTLSLLLAALGGPESFGVNISRLIEESWEGTLWVSDPGTAEVLSWVADGLALAVIAALAFCFYRGWQLVSSESVSARFLLFWSTVYIVLLLGVVPFDSSDLYGYINRGAQQVVFQVNPYLHPVAETPGWESNPLFHPHWLSNPSPYPFFFIRVAQGLVDLSGPTFWGSFLLFKLMNGLLFLTCGWLVYDIARRLKQSRPWLSLYLFAWNPLLLLHALGNGHNDVLLMALLLAAIRCLFSQQYHWMVLALLCLSVLTKYASILALPFILIWLWQNRAGGAILEGGILALVLAAMLAVPYLPTFGEWPVDKMVENAGRPQHSVVAALGHLAYYSGKFLKMLGVTLSAQAFESTALLWIKRVFWTAFAGFYAWRIWSYSRKPQREVAGAVLEIGLALTVMILLVSAKYHPWYVMMFLPVLLLLPEDSRLRQFGVWVSLFHLLAFSPLENLYILNVLLMTGVPWVLVFRPTWLQRIRYRHG